MVGNNTMKNLPITSSYVTDAYTMFDTKLSCNRGEKIRHNPNRAVMDYISVSRDCLKLHKFVTILADMMFVNNRPFLNTMPCSINVVTDEHGSTCTYEQLSKS